jgi:hypothetical protein
MIRCTRFRPYERNSLRGFVDLELTRVGLVLRDCAWHEKNGKQWVAFPARSYADKDGGTQWQPLVEFADGARAAREQFQQQAIEAIHAVVAERENAVACEALRRSGLGACYVRDAAVALPYNANADFGGALPRMPAEPDPGPGWLRSRRECAS